MTSEPVDGVVADATPVEVTPTLRGYEYAIHGLLDGMAELLPEDSGQDTPEAAAQREVLELQLRDLLSREATKVDSVAVVLRRFEQYADECSKEATRLRTRAKAFEGKQARLARYVLDVMEQWGVKRLEGVASTLTRIRNADTVEVDDAGALPFAYQRWSVTFEPASEEALTLVRALVDVVSGMGTKVTVSTEANKVALRELLKRAEAGATEALRSGNTEGAEELPVGVRCRPGTWRLALR